MSIKVIDYIIVRQSAEMGGKKRWKKSIGQLCHIKEAYIRDHFREEMNNYVKCNTRSKRT